jgi:hypothetical protein
LPPARRIARWTSPNEAGRPSPRRADPAQGFSPATTITDLAGTDTKVVFVARHQTMIGSRKADRKSRNAVRVMQRECACGGEEKIWLSPICSRSRATALGALKENDNRKKRRSLISTKRRIPT